MRFRPCIDIHNGKVKQIVGASLRDCGDTAKENFVSSQDAGFFAEFYKKDGLKGGISSCSIRRRLLFMRRRRGRQSWRCPDIRAACSWEAA